MFDLDAFFEDGVAPDVADDDVSCLVGTAEWVDDLLAEQLAEATEEAADYREHMSEDELDDYEDSDDDVEGDGPREDDEYRRAPVVFEPLPPGAGVAPRVRKVWGGPGVGWVVADD